MKRFFDLINKLEELFIGYALLGIAIIATIQVVLRYTTGTIYDWVDEGSRYMTILITFVGAGVCVRYGSHFCMDAFVQYSPNRMKHLLKALANLVSTFAMSVVFYFSWIQIERLERFGATTPSMQIPMWIPYLPIGIFTFVIALRFLVQTIKHIDGLVKNKPFETGKGAH